MICKTTNIDCYNVSTLFTKNNLVKATGVKQVHHALTYTVAWPNNAKNKKQCILKAIYMFGVPKMSQKTREE